MKLGVVLPRGMCFSPNGATSIDIVARDLLLHSAFLKDSYVVGGEAVNPFGDVDFRPVNATKQAELTRGIIRELNSDRPDLIVVHQHPETAGKIARLMPGTPVILHRHGLLKRSTNRISRWRKNRLFRSMAGIVFVSDFIRSEFLGDFPKMASKSHVIHNGVDMEFWSPASSKHNEIVYAGRARQDKGILPLLKAFCTSDIEGWKLKIILAVQTEAEKEFSQHVRRICAGYPDIEISENLTLEEVRNAFRLAQIAALPSIVKEGFHRAVVEALACGCATIASNQGGVREAAGQAAILLDEPEAPDFDKRIKTALIDLTSNEGRAIRMGQQGRLHAETSLSIQAIASQYDCLLQDIARRYYS